MNETENISFTVSRALIIGQGEAHVGDVTIPLSDRLRFLVSGCISIHQTDAGATRVSLHTPRLRPWLRRKLGGAQ